MLVFMAPALILPLSDPLMSLIDAVCLGRVCYPHMLVCNAAYTSTVRLIATGAAACRVTVAHICDVSWHRRAGKSRSAWLHIALHKGCRCGRARHCLLL